MRRICVFCGASGGLHPIHRRAAETLGVLLAARGQGLVFGGGAVGLMGALADAALGAGGEVIGVLPEALSRQEIAHQGLTELHMVPTMHARKALMAELADGFIALPGGLGTLDELFEMLTGAQLGLHRKPIGLLNVEGYFDPLLGQLARGVREGLLRPEHAALLCVADDAAELLERLRAARPVPLPGWISEKDS